MDAFETFIILNSQQRFHNTPTEMLLDTNTRELHRSQLKKAVKAFLEAEQGESVERIIETGIDIYSVMVKILRFYQVPENM